MAWQMPDRTTSTRELRRPLCHEAARAACYCQMRMGPKASSVSGVGMALHSRPLLRLPSYIYSLRTVDWVRCLPPGCCYYCCHPILALPGGVGGRNLATWAVRSTP